MASSAAPQLNASILRPFFANGSSSTAAHSAHGTIYHFLRQQDDAGRRSDEYKADLVQGFTSMVFEKLTAETLKPIVHKVFDWEHTGEAHEYMEGNANIGKIIINGM